MASAANASISLSTGLTSGEPLGVTVTVWNPGPVALTVLGIQGYLYTTKTGQARVSGFHGGYATTPGMPVTVPPGGSLAIPGNVVLAGTQVFETDPAGDRLPFTVEAVEQLATLTYDVSAAVWMSDGGSNPIQTNTAQLVFQPFPGQVNLQSGAGYIGTPSAGQAYFGFSSQSGLIALLAQP